VDQLISMDFGELTAYAELPQQIRAVQVALPADGSELADHKGSLVRISPCELAHAPLKRCFQEHGS
jgi:hypothetical protein